MDLENAITIVGDDDYPGGAFGTGADDPRRAAERLRIALDAARMGDWSWDTATDAMTLSDRAAEVFGFTPGAQVSGQQIVQAIHESDRDRVVREAERVMAGGSNYEAEFRVVRPLDGVTTWVASKGRAYRDRSGALAGMVGVVQDVTDRREWEAERSRLAAIVESSEDAIVSKDLNGIVTSWNKAAEQIYGWPAEEIIGKSKSLVIPKDLPNELSNILALIRRGERIRHYETRRIRKDGVIFHAAISVSPVKDADGNIVGAATIVRDITPQVRTLQQIQALNERLRRAMQETHHRVKNNLQVIAAMVDLQLMDCASGCTVPVDELSRLGSHIRSLAAVHDVLTHYLREDERDQLVSARTVFDKLVPLLEGAAAGRTVRAEVEEAEVTGKQATALALITNELVSNSVKHGAGPVAVRFAAGTDEATLSVADNGPGFPSGFDPDTMANTGLQLVETFARTDLGGSVRYSTCSERGGLVEVTMPLKPSTQAATNEAV